MSVLQQQLRRGLGVFFFGLGGLGIVVPLLPTVPLWILAAVLLAGSSPAIQQRIYDHPQFGSTVRQFVEHRAMTKRSKLFAIAGATLGSAVSLWILRPPEYVVWSVAVIVLGVVIWLVTRPEPD